MKTILSKEQSRYLHKIGCDFPYSLAIQDDDGEYFIRVELEDLLNGRTIPREFELDNSAVCLDIQMTNEICSVSYKYISHGGCVAYYEAKELIDALYLITCWYYEEIKNVKLWWRNLLLQLLLSRYHLLV